MEARRRGQSGLLQRRRCMQCKVVLQRLLLAPIWLVNARQWNEWMDQTTRLRSADLRNIQHVGFATTDTWPWSHMFVEAYGTAYGVPSMQCKRDILPLPLEPPSLFSAICTKKKPVHLISPNFLHYFSTDTFPYKKTLPFLENVFSLFA